MTRSFYGVALLSSAFALSIGACNCSGNLCGDGTVEKDGECVAEGGDNTGEGEGEGGEGEGEGEGEIVCGPGTVLDDDGASCVPQCEDPLVFDSTDNSCHCAAGLLQTGDGCQVDPAVCTEGTVFDDTTQSCRPLESQPRGDDETTDGDPIVITLPDVDDKPLEIGGVTDTPTFFQNDLDDFRFTGVAGTRLRISTVSFGAEAASFFLTGVDEPNVDNNIAAYARLGFSDAENTATREVVLPVDGQYSILVSEKGTFGQLFGFCFGLCSIPTGGPDYTYNLVIDVLPNPAPNSITTSDPVTGSLTTTDGQAAAEALVAPGSFVLATVATPNTAAAPVLWTTVNGRYLEFGNQALFNQVSGGTRFFVDYVFAVDPAQSLDYSLTVTDAPTHDGPTPGTPIVDNTGGDEFSFWEIELTANNVYRVRVQYPESSTLGAALAVVGPDLQALGGCELAEFDPDSDGNEVECRIFATDENAGTSYIVVVDVDDEGLNTINNNVRLFIDEAPVETPVSIGLGDPAVVRTVSAPTELDPDSWAGPWFFVTTSDIVDLSMSGNNTVSLNVFDRGSFGLVAPDTSPFLATPTPGFESFLVQSTGGPGTGDFDFRVASTPAPFDVELEDNNDVANAGNLPINSPTAAVMSAGDVDFFRITANADGMLTVHVTAPPAPLLDAEVVELTILDSDGVTPLAGPNFAGSLATAVGFPDLQAFVSAGTYFARVAISGVQGFPGGAYAIDWTIDTGFTAPPSCEEPAPISIGETTGTNAGGESLFQPTDATCTGQDPNAYFGPEAAYAVDVPAGATLIATVTGATFDAALMLLDAELCDPSACHEGAGSDGFGDEEATLLNDTDQDKRVVVVVDGFGGATGTFTLNIALFGDVCRIGETRCAGDDLEVCNADGSGFDTVTCAGGCAFNAFEERGECVPFCGDATDNPAQFCSDGSTLQLCRADQGAYNAVPCAVACTGDETGGLCTFGLCDAPAATTCEVTDIDEDNTDDAVVVDCNTDASVAVRTACDSGATCADVDACSSDANPLALCIAGLTQCTDGIQDACDFTGTVQTLTFCATGCDQAGIACQLPFGDTCADAGILPFPADGASITVQGDTSAAQDDFDPGVVCPFGTNGTPDVITSFTATENTSVTLEKDSFDGIMYRFTGTCGGAVDQCVDDFGVDPTLDTMTFTAVAGETYFIAVEGFFDGGPFTLTLTNN